MLGAASRAHDRLASATGIGLRELEAFVAVAELGSFSAAARRLNLSQPAVTARIQKLEERLGTRLLVRTTRSVETTDTGRRLAGQAALKLRELNTLLLELMAEAASERPRVVVATTFMVAATILPRLIRRHAEREPDTEVVLRDLRQAAAIDSVQRGESDLAVLALDSPQPGLRFQCLAEDELVVVVPAGHRLAAGESVSLASLVGQNLMLLEQYASIEAMVEAESRQVGLPYRPGAKALSLPTLLGMLDAGVGITILPRSMAQHNASTPRVVLPIAGHRLTRRYGLLTPERRRMSEAARRFCAFLRAEPLLGPPVRAQVRE